MSDSRDWTRITHDPASRPPSGVVVETMSDGGRVTDLKRTGSLYFLPDGTMYVYWTPLFWRAKQ